MVYVFVDGVAALELVVRVLVVAVVHLQWHTGSVGEHVAVSVVSYRAGVVLAASCSRRRCIHGLAVSVVSGTVCSSIVGIGTYVAIAVNLGVAVA